MKRIRWIKEGRELDFHHNEQAAGRKVRLPAHGKDILRRNSQICRCFHLLLRSGLVLNGSTKGIRFHTHSYCWLEKTDAFLCVEKHDYYEKKLG